jgi:hypothetical protein
MSSLALKVAPKAQTGLATLPTQLLLKVIGAAAVLSDTPKELIIYCFFLTIQRSSISDLHQQCSKTRRTQA